MVLWFADKLTDHSASIKDKVLGESHSRGHLPVFLTTRKIPVTSITSPSPPNA